MQKNNSQKIRKMTTLAILVALVVVLQSLSIFIGRFNPVVSFTLALIPIVIGAILYGPLWGAILGAIMGIIVFISVVTGQAGLLSTEMFQLYPIITCIVCISKTALAGFVSGITYKAIAKAGKDKLAMIIASVLCPLVNTGIFLTFLLTVFYEIASKFAAGNMIYFIFVLILGINFVIEFILNSALSPAIVRIIEVVRKKN